MIFQTAWCTRQITFIFLSANKPTDNEKLIEKIIQHLRCYNNYTHLSLQSKFKEEFSNSLNEEEKMMLLKIESVIKLISQKHRGDKLLYALVNAQHTLKKQNSKVEVFTSKLINEENKVLIKQYISETLGNAANIKFLYNEALIDNNEIMIIKFKNYHMKFTLYPYVLKMIQLHKKNNFWNLIK